jgi:hypothetical protein
LRGVERLGHAFSHAASGFVTSAPVTGAIVAYSELMEGPSATSAITTE